ncbi:DNA-binding HxlR family transcriptional regulator [Paenibacillus mucilaginosus]|uniref:hypothetical protein n=1 Tax=Paenibacillus mucilaginosus TaxID=61624 RepID=UPI003D1DDEAF
MIDVNKSLVYDEGFAKVPNILFKLYPLLPGFTVATTGFYGYLMSWRQSKPDHVMHGKTWLNQDEMEAQAGISRHIIRNHIRTLVKYGLLSVEPSRQVANKKIYEVLEPLTEAEFRSAYPEAIEDFRQKLEKIEKQRERDRERRPKKRGQPEVVAGYDAEGRPVSF